MNKQMMICKNAKLFLTRSLSTKRGFTLIEITVALFLVGIILSLVLPKLPDLTGYRLKSQSRKIANIIKYVRNRSVIGKSFAKLIYDLDKGDYWVEVRTGNKWIEYLSTFSTRGKLPDSIRFEEIDTSIMGRVTEGLAETHFTSCGFVEETAIHIQDNRNRKHTLFVYPITGKVTIHEGFLEKRRAN